MKRIAVIGAGYAGCAAAVRLTEADMTVTVFEAGPIAGGRARRVEQGNWQADNGQHIAIGAYRRLLHLLKTLRIPESSVFLRMPMDLHLPGQFRLRCPDWPAPLHLLGGLIGLSGVSWRDRLFLLWTMGRLQLKGFRINEDKPVSAWLSESGQPQSLIDGLWTPLTIAALNTPIELASTRVLFNVLRDSLGGSRADSDLLLPKVDLSRLLAEPAMDFVAAHGGLIRLNCMVRKISHHGDRWRVNDEEAEYDGVVLALPPHRLSMVDMPATSACAPVAKELDAWQYQPIVTLYFEYATRPSLPGPMLGQHGGLIQWVFDREHTHGEPGRIAVVLSARGAHSELSRTDLEATIDRELQVRFGLPPACSCKTIQEKRATFACIPNLNRPPCRTALPSLKLAGDYTAGDYPATLEGAILSGEQAARELSDWILSGALAP